MPEREREHARGHDADQPTRREGQLRALDVPPAAVSQRRVSTRQSWPAGATPTTMQACVIHACVHPRLLSSWIDGSMSENPTRPTAVGSAVDTCRRGAGARQPRALCRTTRRRGERRSKGCFSLDRIDVPFITSHGVTYMPRRSQPARRTARSTTRWLEASKPRHLSTHLIGKYIRGCPVPLEGLQCQLSKSANSDACPCPATHQREATSQYAAAAASEARPALARPRPA